LQIEHIFIDLEVPVYDGFRVKCFIGRECCIGIHGTVEVKIGIPVILLLGTQDTQEEAQAGKKLLGDKPFILVTSASHMPRALNFFNNEGLDPIPAPTNHLAGIQHPNYTKFFSSDALEKSRIAFHELLGLVWQKLKGI